MCAWKKHETMTIASDDVYRGQTTGRRVACLLLRERERERNGSSLSLSFSGEIEETDAAPSRYRAILKTTRCSYVTRDRGNERKARNVRREILVYSVNEPITSRMTFANTLAFFFCTYYVHTYTCIERAHTTTCVTNRREILVIPRNNEHRFGERVCLRERLSTWRNIRGVACICSSNLEIASATTGLKQWQITARVGRDKRIFSLAIP